MHCPNDNTTLVMSDRSGIEIDYCPQCRGVWLDRGELDKIIERSSAPTPQPQTNYQAPAPQNHYQDNRNHYNNDNFHQSHHKKRKESFLGDLFDF
jgi:Zn-finger nucleic acid-binding protein